MKIWEQKCHEIVIDWKKVEPADVFKRMNFENYQIALATELTVEDIEALRRDDVSVFDKRSEE